MPNPMIKIHNAETGEVIVREMTKTEYEDWAANATDGN